MYGLDSTLVTVNGAFSRAFAIAVAATSSRRRTLEMRLPWESKSRPVAILVSSRETKRA